MWELTQSSKFTLSSVWDKIRQKSPITQVSKECWHKPVQLKILVLLCKLIKKAIPTDLAIMRKGIPIASKCFCCTFNYLVEFNNHLLLSSQIASKVWNFYLDRLNVTEHFLT